jgi:hypothetical protein
VILIIAYSYTQGVRIANVKVRIFLKRIVIAFFSCPPAFRAARQLAPIGAICSSDSLSLSTPTLTLTPTPTPQLLHLAILFQHFLPSILVPCFVSSQTINKPYSNAPNPAREAGTTIIESTTLFPRTEAREVGET